MKNIVEFYNQKDAVIKELEELFAESFERIKPFERVEVSGPVVISDDLARQWLDVQYLFSTHFAPGGLPGVAEIGGDILTAEFDGSQKKFLTAKLYLLDFAQRAMRDFRKIEPICKEWQEKVKEYHPQLHTISQVVQQLSEQHKELKDLELPEYFNGCIGWQRISLPGRDISEELEKLGKILPNLSAPATGAIAAKLAPEIKRYSDALEELAKIRKHGKTVPYISRDGFIRTRSPAYSGGLCWHSHPGNDDCLGSLPSMDDLMLVAADCGAIPVTHIGGGETKGEIYIPHLPKKYFFEEVKARVDAENADTAGVMRIKQAVLEARLDDIMKDEVIAIRANGKNAHRILTIQPVVCESEYRKHKNFLENRKLAPEEFPTKELMIDVGDGGFLYKDGRDKMIESIELHGVFFDKEDKK